MNSKITKRKLAIGLSYDWLKIIVVVLLVAFFWILAYTVGAPRASVGQQFQLFVYQNFNVAVSNETLLAKFEEDEVFSYDVLNLSSRTFTSDTYASIMGTIAFASEGDVMIVSNFTSEKEPNSSHFKGFIDNYGTEVLDYDTLILSAKNYCLNSNLVIYDEVAKAYKTNDTAIRAFFSSRMKKDPRFRNTKSAKYEQGVLDEIARIKLIWNNANMLECYLKQCPELRTNYRRFEQSFAVNPNESGLLESYEKQEEKTWGINLGALKNGANSITDVYNVGLSGENGEFIGVSADNINICVFGYLHAQPDHAYESIGVVNYFIKNYSDLFEKTQFVNLIA